MNQNIFELIMNTNKKLSGEDVAKLSIVSKLLENQNKDIHLNIMVGIPGSGKTTYINKTKKAKDLIISPDNIRKELTGDISNQSKNKEVFEIAYDRLRSSKVDTYFDATNVSLNSLENIINDAKQFSRINICIMADSSNLDLCTKRIKEDIDKGKDRSNVPEEIVKNMHQKFVQLIRNPNIINALRNKYKEKDILIKFI